MKNAFLRVLARIRPSRFIQQARRAWYFRGSTVVNEDTSMKVAAFHRGLIYISTQIAKLPWHIKDTNYNILDNNPIYYLLNVAPNPEVNAFRFKLMMIQQAIIHGNFYAEIERSYSGAPIALWALKSTQMEILRDVDGNLFYRYYNDNGDIVNLSPRDVFHVPNFHTKDGLVGQGIVAYAQETLGIQLAADKMAAGLFHNSGIPSGVLEHPGKLSDEAYKRLKDNWEEQTSGDNAGSTSVLEEGMKYNPINIAPEALQFLESRKFGVLEMARFFGIPPTKFFDVEKGTFNNVENANLEVATDTLDSWCTNLEQEADVKLLGSQYGGRFSDIDLYDIFRGDMKSRSEYFRTMMSIGAITPNQIRNREGLPGYGKFGDNYYIATNNFTPVDRMDELIDADITQKTKPTSAPANPGTEEKKKQLQDAVLKLLSGPKK